MNLKNPLLSLFSRSVHFAIKCFSHLASMTKGFVIATAGHHHGPLCQPVYFLMPVFCMLLFHSCYIYTCIYYRFFFSSQLECEHAEGGNLYYHLMSSVMSDIG